MRSIAVLFVVVISSIGAVAHAAPQNGLHVRLDPTGPYLILASEQAKQEYAKAIASATNLHPKAEVATFTVGDLERAKSILLARKPRYVLLFLKPDELDVNFAWQWLTLSTQLDDDPFVDVRTGIITGATPADAAAFMDRIALAARGKLTLPASCLDNLGPNLQAGKADFFTFPGDFMIPVLQDRLRLFSISHGAGAFTDQQLDSLVDAGIVHFGGHGHPDRVDDGVTAQQAAKLKLAPCVVFNGACYTGVTNRWYDQFTRDGKVAEKTTSPADSFCLNLLRNSAVAYLAALHPDHGIPVYQEMEYVAYSGGSLGDAIKHTYDGVVLSNGGQLPTFEHFAAGMRSPRWTPTDVMLKGTASRVLFGDPALIVTDPLTKPPFDIAMKAQAASLHVTATLANPKLKSSYTDTYHADLSRNPNLFNERALIVVDLPKGWDSVGGVQVMSAAAGQQSLQHRLVGYALETDGTRRRLHVQVDLASDDYMQSAFRTAGAKIDLNVSR
jgi:hypothetical protein